MTKKQAIALFGTPYKLAAALRISPQAVYQWPDKLPPNHVDRVMGAAMRHGKLKVK